MKGFGKFLLILALIASVVCCGVLFISNEKLQKENKEQAEQIQMYDDNAQDLAEALKNLRECNNKIKDLESKLNKALADGNAKDSTIAQLRQDLETANADKLTLQNEVTRLQGLLNSYSELANQTYSIQFYNGEENHATRAVSKLNAVLGEDESIGVPTRRNCVFVGWALSEDAEETINLATYEFTQDTILYAKFNEIKYGLFDEEGTVVYSWDELIENHWISNSNAGLDGSLGWEQMVGQLYISDDVTKIDSLAGCAGLTCIKIPQSVVSVNATAFNMCSNLETIIIESDAVVKQMLSDTKDENFNYNMDIWQANNLKIRKDIFEANKIQIEAVDEYYNCLNGFGQYVHGVIGNYCEFVKNDSTSTPFTYRSVSGNGTNVVRYQYTINNAATLKEHFWIGAGNYRIKIGTHDAVLGYEGCGVDDMVVKMGTITLFSGEVYTTQIGEYTVTAKLIKDGSYLTIELASTANMEVIPYFTDIMLRAQI